LTANRQILLARVVALSFSPWGGHNYTDRDRLWATRNDLLHNRGVVRISGGLARAADTLAEQ